ncbi:MAG: hypothetical protein HKN04_13105 [Rhodothermaceae bacterium]|nr:hypothetical protein [Rhodothermaceae bacterium]
MRVLLNQLRSRLRWGRMSEEDQQTYAIIARELAAEDPEPGLWAEALREAKGDVKHAEALYIRRRAVQVRAAMERFKDDVLRSDVDRLAQVPPPIDAGRWSPAYQRVLEATMRGTLRFGLVYYLVVALLTLSLVWLLARC